MVSIVSKKLLRTLPVSRRTPAALRQAIADDDLQAFQKAWVAQLEKPLKRLRKRLESQPLLTLWSGNSMDLNGRERELAATLEDLAQRPSAQHRHRKGKRRNSVSPYEEVLGNWFAEFSGMPGPWETIVLAEIGLREAHRMSAEKLTAILSVLASSILSEPEGGLFDAIENSSDFDGPIPQMIVQGEVPWVCSLLLGPLNGMQTLRKSAVESLEKILLESCDEDGIVHGSLLQRFPEWLAPLTRCTFWSGVFHEPLWNDDCLARLAALTERAAMLVLPVPQHHAADTPQTSIPALTQILQLLLPWSDSIWERRLARLLKECKRPAGDVNRPKKLKKKKPSASENDPEKEDSGSKKKKVVTSWQSDTSCVAIMRSGLDAGADLLTLEWFSGNAELLLAAAGVPILAGRWNWSVWLDDEIVPAPSTWKCSCWFLDPETVFVELEGEDSAPVKRIRQLLLASQDRFAMMTDSVTSRDPQRKVQLITSVPLAEGTICTSDPVTREISLSAGHRSVRTFPVWLEDDRIQHTMGSYRENDGQLELAGTGKGGVTLPLALDWHPSRTSLPADWTRLTVTEARDVVGADRASGFRIRVGDHQVMLYRSLLPGKDSRAVLGVHTWDESVYMRVASKGGQFESMVEVETPG